MVKAILDNPKGVESMDAALIGPRIRALREARGINQGQLAEGLRKLGLRRVKQGAVSSWETGTRTPDVKVLIRLAEFFGVAIDSFLEPPKPKRRRRGG
jgi:transcriptional regulator with XRE-family HTH domain